MLHSESNTETDTSSGKEPKKVQASPKGYFASSRRWIYAFSFVLPLAILYEVAVVLVNRGNALSIRNAADVWIRQIMEYLGLGGTLPLLLASILLWVVIYITTIRKEQGFHFRFGYLLGMLVESAVWGVVFLFAIGYVTYLIFNLHPLMQASVETLNKGSEIVLSLGAGVYEELIFRVLLMGGLLWILTRLGMYKFPAALFAIITTSLLFSWVHYLGGMGDVFRWDSFLNRTIAGMAFAGLYAWRGYGITAWTHALYDIYIITLF